MAILQFFISKAQGLQLLKEDGKTLCRFSPLPTPIQVDNSDQIIYMGQLTTDKPGIADALRGHSLFNKEFWQVPQLPVRGALFSRVIAGNKAADTVAPIVTDGESLALIKDKLIRYGELKQLVISPTTGKIKPRTELKLIEEFNNLAEELGYEKVN